MTESPKGESLFYKPVPTAVRDATRCQFQAPGHPRCYFDREGDEFCPEHNSKRKRAEASQAPEPAKVPERTYVHVPGQPPWVTLATKPTMFCLACGRIRACAEKPVELDSKFRSFWVEQTCNKCHSTRKHTQYVFRPSRPTIVKAVIETFQRMRIALDLVPVLRIPLRGV